MLLDSAKCQGYRFYRFCFIKPKQLGIKITPPPPPTYPPRLGLRDIQHVTRHEVSCLINYNTLFQNATDIITKCDPTFLQNAPEVYYKMRQVFYYKMRQ